jgi:hypothetical protein
MAPGDNMIKLVSQVSILRKPKTLKNPYPVEQRERLKKDAEYCKHSLSQARRRALVDPLFSELGRMADSIRDQYVKFIDPSMIDSPAKTYASSRVVHAYPVESASYYMPVGHRATHSLDAKMARGETLNAGEELSFSVGRYELSARQKKELLVRDIYIQIQESTTRTEEEKKHYMSPREYMQGDVDRSLQACCRDMVSCWRCGSGLLEEDFECTLYSNSGKQPRFGGLGCGTCGCPLPIAPDVIATETLKHFGIAWVDKDVEYYRDDPIPENDEDEPNEDDKG